MLLLLIPSKRMRICLKYIPVQDTSCDALRTGLPEEYSLFVSPLPSIFWNKHIRKGKRKTGIVGHKNVKLQECFEFLISPKIERLKLSKNL